MQLDLLDWRPAEPAPVILPFPMSRRVGEARAVAQKVSERRTDAQRQAYFRRALGGLASRLAKSGLGDDEVSRQLDAFTAAVNLELWRYEGHRRPGGAA